MSWNDNAYARIARKGCFDGFIFNAKSMGCGHMSNIVFGKTRLRSMQILCVSILKLLEGMQIGICQTK